MEPVIWSYWNHEPIYHLKRMGNDGGTVFSLGEWVDEWYDRIHGEELIKKGAELGINTVYTHYYKGSGILFEKEEMDRTKEFTKLAHKYGIRVLGYMSMGSIYTENISKEIPDVKQMLVVDRFGQSRPTLSNQYYRPRPCYNSAQYLTHLKSIIRYGIEEIGLDGFHFDNSAFAFCYCENCRQKFREFLRANFKNPYAVMGIKDFDHVEIPALDHSTDPEDIHEICPKGNIHDPLFLWYFRFLSETVGDFHKACFNYVKELSGGKALVLHNPGFPRFGRMARIRGYDPSYTPQSCDFAFVENRGGYFGKHAGRITGQSMAFKYGERFGYKVFDTSWVTEADGTFRFPKNKAEISGFLMHAAVFGGIVGVPWTVRSMKERDTVAIDTAYLREGLEENFSYFRKNYPIYASASYSHVKLLHHPDNYFCAGNGRSRFFETTETLTKNHIPYSIITEDQVSALKKGDVVVLPCILYCAKSLYSDLSAAAQRGVSVIAIDGFGHYNEFTKGRSTSDDAYNLRGIDGSILIDLEKLPNFLPRNLAIDLSDILLETRITSDGILSLHILNADAERMSASAKVTFTDERLIRCRSWKIYTPDSTEAQVTLLGNTAIIELRNFKTLVTVLFEEEHQ